MSEPVIDLGDPPPAAPASRRRGPRRVAVAAVTALALGAGAFGVLALSAGDGADDPGAAVEAMFDAIDNEDVIGVMEALAPNERRILRPAVEEAAAQAERLKLASPDLDLRGVAGTDLEVSGLSYTTEELGDGFTAVDLTGGTVSTAADLDRMPVGTVIRRILDRDAAEADGEVDRSAQDAIELAGARLVARQVEGGWHVSALYSIAEAARLDQDDVPPVPAFGQGIPAKGAADPEAAVLDMLAAATSADVQRLIELTPPDEASVLHDYGPILVDATTDAEGGAWEGPEIEDLTLATSDGPDGTKVVSATGYRMVIDDDYSSTTWTYDGTCSTITTTYTDEGSTDYAPDDEAPSSAAQEETPIDPEAYETCDDDTSAATPANLLSGLGGASQFSVVTEQHDGAWFVSPTRTLIQATFGNLADLTPEQADQMARVFSGEGWLTQSDSFWEACGMTKPGPDMSSDEANAAEEACWNDLPEDYQYEGGAYGGGGMGMLPWVFFLGSSGSTESKFESVGESIEEPVDGFDDYPEQACYELDGSFDDEGSDGDVDAGSAAVESCLADLVDSGEVDPEVLLEFTCNSVYDELDVTFDEDIPEAELDDAYEAADQAFQACIEAGSTDGASTGN